MKVGYLCLYKKESHKKRNEHKHQNLGFANGVAQVLNGGSALCPYVVERGSGRLRCKIRDLECRS